MRTKHNCLFLMITAILLITVVSSCKKDDASDDDNTPIIPAITVDSENQFSGTLNGINFSWKESNNAFIYHSLLSTFSNDTTRYVYYSEIGESGSTSPWNYIKIFKGNHKIQGTNYATSAQAKSFFAVGSYPYSNDALNGIAINFSYLDSTTIKSYTTNNVTQTGSSFKIDGVKEETLFEFIKIKASFTCKLKDGNGNIVTLTNGIFVGEFSYTDF